MRARIVIQPHGTKHIVPNWRSIRRPKKTGGAMRLAHILRNCRQVQDTTRRTCLGVLHSELAPVMTGVRYSGELGHPFHVVDDEIVILCLDHPFIPEGRFASLLVRDKELARQLADGFKELWSKAMRDIREIDFHPQGSARQG